MINYLNFFERWLKIGSIIFISSFIWSPSRDGLEAVYGLFFLMPLLFLILKNNIFSTAVQQPLIKAILIFSFYSTISSLWNDSEGILYFLLQFFILSTWTIGAYWLISNNKIDARRILLLLIYMGSIASLITVISFYYQNRYQGIYHFEVRLTCWCAAESANLVGGLYGVLAVISYAFFLACGSYKERIKFGLISAILLLPLIFSQSRGALIAFLVASLIAFFIIRPKAWLIILQFAIALPVISLFAFINYTNLKALWTERTGALGQRDLIWNYVYQQLFENFYTGIGMSQNTKIFINDSDNIFHHAHNSWLDTFFRTGLIGFALIMVITYMLMKKAFSLKSLEGKVLLLWLVFGLVTLTLDHRTLFWQIDTKWFFYWIPAPFIISLYDRQKKLD